MQFKKEAADERKDLKHCMQCYDMSVIIIILFILHFKISQVSSRRQLILGYGRIEDFFWTIVSLFGLLVLHQRRNGGSTVP